MAHKDKAKRKEYTKIYREKNKERLREKRAALVGTATEINTSGNYAKKPKVAFDKQPHGHLEFIEVVGQNPNRRFVIRCKCECGEETDVEATTFNTHRKVTCGKTGCPFLSRLLSAACLKHGGAVHGRPNKEYTAWMHIKDRCLNPKSKLWKYYGGRGIKMHAEWIASFPEFRDHVGLAPSPSHSLDRIDNESGYQPGNVRWATKKEQGRNRRTNRTIIHYGTPRLVCEVAEMENINENALWRQMFINGRTTEDAIAVIKGRQAKDVLS